MIHIYRCLATVLSPLIAVLVLKRRFKGLEDKKRYRERFGYTEAPRFTNVQKTIWFHAASVGETKSVIPLINYINQHYPDVGVLITTVTQTAYQTLIPHLNDRFKHQFVPFDIPIWVKRFFKYWQPDLFVMLESEIWPNLMWQAHQLNVPIIILNARLSDRSYLRWKKFPGLIRSLLGYCDHVYAQSKKSYTHLLEFIREPESLSLMTNLKYMSPPLTFNEKSLESLKDMVRSRPMFLAASTHKSEEEIILGCHDRLIAEFPDLLTIIVPRHPNRGPQIAKLCGQKTVALRSMSQQIHDATQIYIADTLGELGLFFELCPFTFMGGSFLKQVNGHNPIEPAMFSKGIIVGPHMGNFSDIMEDLQDTLCQVHDQEELFMTVSGWLRSRDIPESYGEKCNAYVDKKSKDIAAIVKIIMESMEQSNG
jgi:3-deoxy-D-manno-octulosonic-acid transferase